MADRLNVVIFHTHDTGRHLGVYGRGPHTPRLSQLGAEGVVFENAFCSAPQCSPSRASLFTGTMPHRNGMIGLAHRGFCLGQAGLDGHLAAVLGRAGYATHLFGVQHEATDPAVLGYAHVAACKSRRLADVAPAAQAFFEGKPERPFLAVVAFAETHRPFSKGEGCEGEVRVPPYLPDHPEVRRDVADLTRDAEAADAAFGRVLDALDAAGLRDRTLVIYTTDHGIAFPGAKATLFDPGIETALIARGPGGFEGGRRIPALVSNVDVFPTLMDLLDVDGGDRAERKSLLPIVRGEVEEVNEAVFVEQTYHAGYDPMRGIRTRRYKYIRNFEPRTMYFFPNVDAGPSKTVVAGHTDLFRRPRPEAFLFDLKEDPQERRNLAGDPAWAAVEKDLHGRLLRWMEATEDPMRAGFVPPPSGATITRDDAVDPGETLSAEAWLAAREKAGA